MSHDRYVMAGLAHVRSHWFTDVARWATVGSLPVEFVKCLSEEELRARLAGGRPFSAALLDGRLRAVDRDLLATVAAHGASPLVVDDQSRRVDWIALGAAVVLPAPLDRDELITALSTHAQPIRPVDARQGVADEAADRLQTAGGAHWRAPLITVVGHAGAGTSTVAAALAQGLGDDARHGGDVLLADLARHAHQAILHDTRDVVPGLQDLVEATRSGNLTVDDIRLLTFAVPGRGYRLLIGLRDPRDWVSLRPAASAVALDHLRGATRCLVADTDADLEGEADTGSFDVEDRNQLARLATAEADVVVAVALPTTTGLCDITRLLADLRRHGIGPTRTLVVLNRGPRRPAARAGLTRTLNDLSALGGPTPAYTGPVFLNTRRGVDEAHRDLARFPAAWSAPVVQAVGGLLERLGPRDRATEADTTDPEPVTPGSLGHWAEAASPRRARDQ